MKKNGFTLIELLAVIVILAIIALIAVPIIMNIINTSRKGAAEDSTYGIIKAAETYYAERLVDLVTFEEKTFECNASGCGELSFKGTNPTSGSININKDGIITVSNLCVNGYIVEYDGNKATATRKCDEAPGPKSASEISYTREDDSSITSVDDALNDLYTKLNN